MGVTDHDIQIVDHSLEYGQKFTTDPCEVYRSRVSIEEFDLKSLLQPAYLNGQSGLGEMKNVGGTGEAATLSDRKECPDLPKIQIHNFLLSLKCN
jgi:hypothetical protein